MPALSRAGTVSSIVQIGGNPLCAVTLVYIFIEDQPNDFGFLLVDMQFIKALDNGDKSHDSLEPKEKNRGFVRLNYGASQMNKKLEFFSSMAVAFIVLILVFLCIRFSGQGKFATHGGTNPSDVKCIYTSVWPDNEYTRLICEPESGTIEYILDGSNAGYYAIFYNNISEEEIQKYIDQLKTLGYAEEASASESVSTGVLLRKDETWISIAYSEGGFGIRISVEKS